MAYRVYCSRYRLTSAHHKTPVLAAETALLYGLPNVESFEDAVEDAWVKSVQQYFITRDKTLNLRRRCQAEVAMRQHWSTFVNGYSYREPSVPPVPPLTPKNAT